MLDAAIVGLGRWGQNYVNSAQGVSSLVRFTRAVVRTPEKSREFAQKHSLRLSTDYVELLADPSINMIVLATPNSQHADQIVAAAKAGKAVLCEKPLALTRADAERAVRACKEAGVLLGVGQDKRFWPSMQELKRVVDSGVLGEVLYVEGHFSNENASNKLHHGWRESPAESPGGSITATGIHVLDAFINMIGPLRRVSAQHILKRPPPESLDTLSITFEFANRVSGVLCGVRATPLFWRVHVFGNQGSAESAGPNELILRMSGGKVERRTFEPINALRANLEAFANAIEGRGEYPISTAQMVDVIAGIEAIVAAVETGNAVTVTSSALL